MSFGTQYTDTAKSDLITGNMGVQKISYAETVFLLT